MTNNPVAPAADLAADSWELARAYLTRLESQVLHDADIEDIRQTINAIVKLVESTGCPESRSNLLDESLYLTSKAPSLLPVMSRCVFPYLRSLLEEAEEACNAT